MATTKITNPDLFDLGSLDSALKLPSGTEAQRPASPSTGEWRYNTDSNTIEFWDGIKWRTLSDQVIPPIPSENFNTVLYTGNGATQSITGVGFKPDFVWIKPRSFADNHALSDSTRGVNKSLAPNTTSAEQALGVTSFDADGFSLPNWGNVNQNGATFVAWCWKANGGTTTAGSGTNTTSVTNQANTKAGFSITTFTGSASAAGNFTHGLGEVPDMYIVKTTSFSDSWFVWHKDLTNTTGYAVRLNTNAAQQNLTGFWNDTAPTSTLISLGNGVLVNNATYVAYAFKSVAGYSSIGSYTGNGSTNGPVVNTGFEPAWLMLKRTDSAGSWAMIDNKRTPTNPRNKELFANLTDAENTFTAVNFSTNGFQIINTSNTYNANGGSFIYIAFASDGSAAPTLPDSFNTSLWTGNGSSQSISGLGFSPNLVWGKERSNTSGNEWLDTLRGVYNYITSNSTGAQGTSGQGLQSFDSDGFSVGNDGAWNQSSETYVGWSWKANPLPTINTTGTIQSTVSANQAAGFSIVKYTGDGTSGSTVGHGLGATPEIVIYKRLDAVANWIIKSTLWGVDEYLIFNTDALTSDSGVFWNSTSPTSSVFSLGNSASVNSSSGDYIAYCFASITGFCKIGTYTGNGTTLPVTGLGFSPDCVLIKPTSLVEVWSIFDSSRGPNRRLTPSGGDVEYVNSGGGYLQSFDGDGFTAQAGASGNQNTNNSGATYLYVAWKANPTYGGVSAGKMAYLVVAGGGSGGWNSATWDGAGGGGGVITSYGTQSGGDSPVQPSLTLASGTYTITIGAGGFSNSGAVSVNGNNSTITGNASITCVGGGGGGDVTTSPLGTGRDGGSGGGGSNYSGNALGGSGEPSQGYQGGQGSSSNGGGGGGAGKPGLSDGTGGDGIYCSISGTATYYAGGAAGFNGTGTAGQGGGGTPASAPGGVNTGGGGAGTRSATSADGGSGIIILRLKTSEYSGTTTGSPTVTTDGDETVLTYTGSGTYVHS
jgi:hypothetical protein